MSIDCILHTDCLPYYATQLHIAVLKSRQRDRFVYVSGYGGDGGRGTLLSSEGEPIDLFEQMDEIEGSPGMVHLFVQVRSASTDSYVAMKMNYVQSRLSITAQLHGTDSVLFPSCLQGYRSRQFNLRH